AIGARVLYASLALSVFIFSRKATTAQMIDDPDDGAALCLRAALRLEGAGQAVFGLCPVNVVLFPDPPAAPPVRKGLATGAKICVVFGIVDELVAMEVVHWSLFAPSFIGADEVSLFVVHGHNVLSCRIASVGHNLSGRLSEILLYSLQGGQKFIAVFGTL